MLERDTRERIESRMELNLPAGCSKKPFGKAAASEGANRTLPTYVEPLSDARTQPAAFFNILLG
jgi:hypothetical protein